MTLKTMKFTMRWAFPAVRHDALCGILIFFRCRLVRSVSSSRSKCKRVLASGLTSLFRRMWGDGDQIARCCGFQWCVWSLWLAPFLFSVLLMLPIAGGSISLVDISGC